MAMARSFLRGMGLPSYLWGEAVRHSIYILNRLPTRILCGRTPYEAWTGMKPDLKFIKVFGCTTFMKLPLVHIKKLDNRSKAVINLGKEPGTKGFRLYDPNTGSLFVSRDVTFDETKAWAWEQQNKETYAADNMFTVAGSYVETEDGLNAGETGAATPT